MKKSSIKEIPEDYYSNPRIRYAESLEDSIKHLPKNKDEPDSARLIYIPGRPLDEFKVVSEIGFEAVRDNLKRVSQFYDKSHFEEWCDQQEEEQRPLLSAVYNKLSEIKEFYSEHLSASPDQFTLTFDGNRAFHDDARVPYVIHYAAYGFGNEAIIDELTEDQYDQIENTNQAVGHRGILTKPGDMFVYVNSERGVKDGQRDCTSVKHRGYYYESPSHGYSNQSLRFSIGS